MEKPTARLYLEISLYDWPNEPTLAVMWSEGQRLGGARHVRLNEPLSPRGLGAAAAGIVRAWLEPALAEDADAALHASLSALGNGYVVS
jgi:hypothetical protein